MTIDADLWIDRRRLKRNVSFWRVAAVIFAVVAVIAVVGRFDGVVPTPYIARVSVDGLIVDDLARDRLLQDIRDNDDVRAVLVRIDSPGGTVVGGEALYTRLRDVAEEKPVVAVLGQLATSAAYMTALGTDHVISREGTVTGSIGVLLQSADVTDLLEKLGIKPQIVKSSPLKAQPNPLETFTPEAREVTREVVLDIYGSFVDLVAERRGLERAAVLELADGRVFTGRQALAEGLVDALGGEDEARSWLAEAHGLDRTLPLRDLDTDGAEQTLRDLVGGALESVFFRKTYT